MSRPSPEGQTPTEEKLMTEIEHDDTRQTDTDTDRRTQRDLAEDDIAWLLVGGGVVGSLITLLRGRRTLVDWALPAGLVGAGVAILLKRRQTHLEATERNILAELESLDPIARAQVLKAVAEQQFHPGR